MTMTEQWWIVTGRVESDDEDTLLVLRAESEEEAVSRYQTGLAEYSDIEGREIFINYIVACGAEEPKILRAVPA